MSLSPIPITVFTGFLGAGKTTIILALLERLPRDYKVVLLKNEFGDIEVDSKLAKESNLLAVSEILNGCMCCVLVGQMEDALLEIRDKYRPDRIIIECSGSAFPATLAFQIRKIERETSGDLKLDAIITVIDAENFAGYEDTSPTAKMQASYSDMILINKWEGVSDRSLDLALDHLHTLNDLTPKVRCQGRQGVDPSLVFGLESKLFLNESEHFLLDLGVHDEVETATIYLGPSAQNPPIFEPNAAGLAYNLSDSDVLDRRVLVEALGMLSKESVWRVKGFVRISGEGHPNLPSWHILNWAFGRYDLIPVSNDYAGEGTLKLTMMGERGEVKRAARIFSRALGIGAI